MWDLALVEAYLNPDMAKFSSTTKSYKGIHEGLTKAMNLAG